MENTASSLIERTLPELHASLVKHLPAPTTVKSVVDLGCGTGAWLQRLKGAGYGNLMGVDLDVRQFAAVGIAHEPCNIDVDPLPVAAHSVDLLTAIEFIEHLQNPGNLFAHAARVLSPTGVLLMTTPNVESIMARLRFLLTGRLKQFDQFGDPGHVSPIFEFCLRRVLESHGLEIVKSWGFPEDGSAITSTIPLKILAAILRPFLREPRGGEVACYLIRRAD